MPAKLYAIELLKFFALPADEQVRMVFDAPKNAWFVELNENPLVQVFEDFLGCFPSLRYDDEFWNIFDKDDIAGELKSLLELLYFQASGLPMSANEYLKEDSVNNCHLWALIRRLAKGALILIGEEVVPPSRPLEDFVFKE